MIKGVQVLFRALEQPDEKLYHQWINDSETNHWRGLYHPTSEKEAAEWIQANQQARQDRITFAILVDGVPVGFIGLRGICARSRRAEIWIYIGAVKKWGQGIATDSIRTLCKYAFEEMNLFRIWLECDPEHLAAFRCYEKVGFRKEGILRKAYYRRGSFRDTCMMGLLRDELEKT